MKKNTTKLNARYTSKNSKLKVKPEWTLIKIVGDNISLQFNDTIKVFTVAQFEKNWELAPEKVETKKVEKKTPAAKTTKKTPAKPAAKKVEAKKQAAKKSTKAPTKKIETKETGLTIEKKSFEDYKVKKAGKRVNLLLGARVYEERKIFTKGGKEFFKFGDKDYPVANTKVINHVYKIEYDIVDAGTKAEFHRNGQKVNSRQVKVDKDGKRYFRFNKHVYFLDETGVAAD
jgi:hypothetical protein